MIRSREVEHGRHGRGSGADREAERGDLRKVAHEPEVLRGRLAEAETWVRPQLFGGHTGGTSAAQGAAEILQHFRPEILVVRLRAAMHQNERAT